MLSEPWSLSSACVRLCPARLTGSPPGSSRRPRGRLSQTGRRACMHELCMPVAAAAINQGPSGSAESPPTDACRTVRSLVKPARRAAQRRVYSTRRPAGWPTRWRWPGSAPDLGRFGRRPASAGPGEEQRAPGAVGRQSSLSAECGRRRSRVSLGSASGGHGWWRSRRPCGARAVSNSGAGRDWCWWHELAETPGRSWIGTVTRTDAREWKAIARFGGGAWPTSGSRLTWIGGR